jgi:uncharacterized protein
LTGRLAQCYPGFETAGFKKETPLKLLVDRLTTTPEEFDFEGDARWWAAVVHDEAEGEPALEGVLRFHLKAQKMGEDIYVEGEASGTFVCACSRCLARYRHALREPFRIVLEPAAGRVPSDPEGAEALARSGVFLGDELDAGWYNGPEIDLTRYLQEVVALGLPVQPLCREECRGLCPQCGVDRNTETCDCREASSSSPFAALRSLVTERGD